jgi:hypothetical protein
MLKYSDLCLECSLRILFCSPLCLNDMGASGRMRNPLLVMPELVCHTSKTFDVLRPVS